MKHAHFWFVALAAIGLATGLTLSNSVDAATPGTVTYRYDSVGGLVQDVYPANVLSYSYDAAGNRVTSTVQ